MALSITATAAPATGSVLLEITASGTVDGVTRADENGTAAVRTLAGLFPDTGTIVLSDYEAALTGTVVYTVTDGTDTATDSVTLEDADDRPWLFVPVIPEYSTRVAMVTGYTGERASASTMHLVIGRPDPVVTLGALGTRMGTLDVWCADYAAVRDVLATYSRSQVVMLRQATFPGLDAYHVAEAIEVAPAGEPTTPARWVVRVGYREVGRPTADLLGTLGRSFADLLTEASTFAALTAMFEDFDAVTVGA